MKRLPPRPAGVPRWERELARSIRTLDGLAARFPGFAPTDAMREAARRFPMAITPHVASLIERPDFSDPVFAQFVPGAGELADAPWASADPLGEVPRSPVPGLVRRYPDRALLLATSACAAYCRHCFRKRVSARRDAALPAGGLRAAARWLRAHPEVDDVLVSGGDPLMLPDARLARLLAALHAVPSVRVIRIATRLPCTLPSRVTPALVRLLRPPRGGPATFVSTQFNHPNELAPAALRACARLVDAGIPVQNQTVLLRGVNDDPATIEALCRTLYHNRIRPYYLFQADLVRGIEHFRTPLATGLAIMRHLRARLSGPAIPNFCVDPPGGGAKIELAPGAVAGRRPDGTLLRGCGGPFFYPDPVRAPRA
ncbi:MAG: KamA family radical SAM protein [Kiritimatiellae bacterium]|nr:KamA family radical SAM protein [Kiritimatiellia bacterium]